LTKNEKHWQSAFIQEVTSRVARQKGDKARSQIANGIDPSLKRKVVLQ
jgi:hypothetical protein